MLLDRYQEEIYKVLDSVRSTQREAITEAGRLVAKAVIEGGKIHLAGIVHGVEKDLLYRGGGPIFYKAYKEGETEIKAGDLIFVSSVSGRTKKVVELAYECMQKGAYVIALTSLTYAATLPPVHECGKKLHEFVTLAIDNCAPAAEAILKVDGIDAPFAACSGMSSTFIMWSLTSVAVEEMLNSGYTPGILKSAKAPGGNDYNKTVIEPHYEKFGW